MSFWPALGAGSWLRTNLLSHQTACQASLCTERHARHGLRGGPSQFPPGDSVNTLVGTPCPGGHPPWVDQDAADSGRGWQRVRGGGKEGAGCPGRTVSSKAHSGGPGTRGTLQRGSRPGAASGCSSQAPVAVHSPTSEHLDLGLGDLPAIRAGNAGSRLPQTAASASHLARLTPTLTEPRGHLSLVERDQVLPWPQDQATSYSRPWPRPDSCQGSCWSTAGLQG